LAAEEDVDERRCEGYGERCQRQTKEESEIHGFTEKLYGMRNG